MDLPAHESGGQHYRHTLVSIPGDGREEPGVLTGFGRGEMAHPKGKTLFFITYKQHGSESGITMYADPELIEKHWEDFRKMLRNARRFESRRATIELKPEAASGLTV